MLNMLYPKEYAKSTYLIDFKKYYEAGFRGVLFDIDNTLVAHNAPYTDQAVKLFEELRGIGFKLGIVSNNHEPRVKPFAEAVGAEYIFDAGKPSGKGYLKSIDNLGTNIDNTLFVGDQLLTDMLGANRLNIHCILVGIVDPKEIISIKLKRKLEKILLKFHKKSRQNAWQK